MSVPFYDKIDVFVPVGGPAVTISDTTNSFGLYWSSGTPESSVSAPVGSICSDYTNGNIYKKSTGVGNTGWTILATGSGATNLAVASRNTTTLDITSDTGTNATVPAATGSLAGLLSSADKTKIDRLTVSSTINLDTQVAYVSNLITLTGVAANSVNLGTFSGSTITVSSTIKAALQSLETAVEARLASALTNGRIFVGNASNVATGVAMSGDVSITNTGSTTVVTGTSSVAGKLRLATNAEVLAGVLTTVASTPNGISDYIVALIGNSVGVANLGSFTGSTISAGSSVKSALQQIVTKLDGLVSGLQFTGTWDATTASPVAGMTNNTFKRVSVAGTTTITTENFGVVSEWAVGDYLMKAADGTVHKIDNTDVPVNLGVASVTHTTLDITSSTGSNTTVPQAIASSTATSSSGKAGLVTGNDKFKIENTGGYQTLYGGTTSNTITHNLGTKNVSVAVYRVSDDVQVFPTIVSTSNSVVTITHSIAPSASSFRAVVSRVAV